MENKLEALIVESVMHNGLPSIRGVDGSGIHQWLLDAGFSRGDVVVILGLDEYQKLVEGTNTKK